MYAKPSMRESVQESEVAGCCTVTVRHNGIQETVNTGLCNPGGPTGGRNFPTCDLAGVVPCVITVGPVTVSGYAPGSQG